jgi:hypothetical protein
MRVLSYRFELPRWTHFRLEAFDLTLCRWRPGPTDYPPAYRRAYPTANDLSYIFERVGWLMMPARAYRFDVTPSGWVLLRTAIPQIPSVDTMPLGGAVSR